jgi:hypothetical protein
LIFGIVNTDLSDLPVLVFIPSNTQLIHRLVVSAGEMVARMMVVSATAGAKSMRCP